MREPREVVVRPLMTEKSMRLKDERNIVTFQVVPDEIGRASCRERV